MIINEMRKAMISSMKFWLTDFDIDGFRCDVAMMVPTDFWNTARTELDKIKPVFMLAEAEQTDLVHTAFDMNYAWNLHHIMNEISKGKQNADSLRSYFDNAAKEYPPKVYRMIFTSNHDKNSWNGTVFERMPKSYKTWAVFSFVVPGMPLIYSGQEAKLNKRLKFFEKDTIDWSDTEMQELYTKLIKLKNENPALWNGEEGGKIEFVKTNKPNDIFAFWRKKDNNKVIVLMNLSNKEISFTSMFPNTKVKDYFTEEKFVFNEKVGAKIKLKAWEYKIFIAE